MSTALRIGLDFDQVMAALPDGRQAILVQSSAGLRGYVNSCPHVGVPLDWGDGRCLVEPDRLMCSMHGAVFAADDGRCLGGPCFGDQLEPLPLRVVGDRIELAIDR